MIAVTGLGSALVFLEAAVVNVALPSIRRDLHASTTTIRLTRATDRAADGHIESALRVASRTDSYESSEFHMQADRRSMTTGLIIFVILVVGAYVAVREVASAGLRKVPSTPPSISLPKPPFTVTPPTAFTQWDCSGSTTSVPQQWPIDVPSYGLCTSPRLSGTPDS